MKLVIELKAGTTLAQVEDMFGELIDNKIVEAITLNSEAKS